MVAISIKCGIIDRLKLLFNNQPMNDIFVMATLKFY